MAEHYKVICKSCNKMIGQCRCPDLDKKIHYETCDECKNKKIIENSNQLSQFINEMRKDV